ncbi:ATP F0F1 synthase subunit I [Roseibium denhamense]|uniref:ATP synthase protein I n=1 Tax=Roseibium denhamense TaxID=76305 RepID=A0ABY1P333_9HYPH|nr:AtpZ/AtpI family protein [Roseibium denhamense]MTI07768.1 ATP F0F1 synthase subunit I [Roseibium denhamense]SMP25312.1 ATP synthase protein I [Roseibium denhamense]
MIGSSQNGGIPDPDRDLSEAELSERRNRLNQRLEGQRAAEEAERKSQKSDTSGYAQAMKLSSEFISGIVVGCGIGWLIDQWLGTMPFGLIVFLLIGFAAGVLNVLRASGEIAHPETRMKRGKPEDDGDNK